MHEGAPFPGTCTHLCTVGIGKRIDAFKTSHGLLQRHWVVQGAEGINHDVEAGLDQLLADIVCKTAAQDKYPVFV